MRRGPPNGFEELGSAAERPLETEFNAVGVVVDFLPPSKTRGPDHIITFTLTDHSWSAGEGLKCRFFGRTEDKIPNVSSKGDVVVLRSVRLKRFNGRLLALSNYNSSWLVFHQQDLQQGLPDGVTAIEEEVPVTKMSDQVPSPSKDMVAYAVDLHNLLDRSRISEPAPITSLEASNLRGSTGTLASTRPTKFKLIKDLTLPKTARDCKFADLLGEVRKIYMNDYRVELTITDYTSHQDLYDYIHESEDDQGRDGDPYGYTAVPRAWPGPWGKMSMMVAAWDAHATFAREHVGLNSLVFLRNVQIGLDREGERMEGRLRGDKLHPETIGISICKARQAEADERIKALLTRKRDYEADLKLHGIKGLEESRKVKEQATLQQPVQKQELTRAEKNKKKKEKARAKRKRAQTAKFASNAAKPTSNALNPNIRTNKPPDTVTPVKISEIMDPSVLASDFPTVNGNPFTFPFKNNLYHVENIRVIDFHPPDLADFAAPHKPSDYECLSDHETDSDADMSADSGGADVEWEWRFELLVEDAASREGQSARMRLLVAGPDADFLLRNIRATDLRADGGASLARLKEKLFLLWGDLQERKEEDEEEKEEKAGGEGKKKAKAAAEPSGRPFGCLVREYGVPAGQGRWERVFSMFGTSIVSD